MMLCAYQVFVKSIDNFVIDKIVYLLKKNLTTSLWQKKVYKLDINALKTISFQNHRTLSSDNINTIEYPIKYPLLIVI